MKHVTAALQEFLARNNIRGRDNVALVLVTNDPRTAAEIGVAIKLENKSDEFFRYSIQFPRADAVVNGIPIAVRTPKMTIEV